MQIINGLRSLSSKAFFLMQLEKL